MTQAKTAQYVFSGDEIATILHSLRVIQETANGEMRCRAADCDHFEHWTELTDKQIDALCERINLPDTAKPPTVENSGVIQTDTLPPDPEGENDRRAAEAEKILFQFEETNGEAPYTGISTEQLTGLHEQNLTDLLANLAHWCDRNGCDLSKALCRAKAHYDEETGSEGEQFAEVSR